MVSVSEKHIETMRDAPFIVSRFPGLAHDLSRKGLLQWKEGAWRLTPAGHDIMAVFETKRAA